MFVFKCPQSQLLSKHLSLIFRTQRNVRYSSIITLLGQIEVFLRVLQLCLDLDIRFILDTRPLVDHLLCIAGR